MLQLRNVKKIYMTKSGDMAALNGINLDLPDKGMVFITGKSGSGKTTMLNIIGGLDGVTEGEIIVDGKSFSSFSAKEYDSYRNTFIGFIFQEYNLLPDFTVEKNIRIANELQGLETDKSDISSKLSMVGIDGLGNRKPSELSGGQKQRVAIARALIKNPKVIMADEPTGALDSATGIQVMETLKKLSRDKLVLIVSHDLELAEKYADRIITIKDGQIINDQIVLQTEINSNVYEREDSLTIKEGAKLTKEEVDVLVKAIEDRKKLNVTDSIEIREKKTNTEGLSPKKSNSQVKLINSKMKFTSSAYLGLKSLTVKPFRLIFTIFLAVVAFAIFGIFDTVASFSQAKLVKSSLQKGFDSVEIVANYMLDEENGYHFRFSDEDIEKISKDTKMNFKGVYDIYDSNMSHSNLGSEIQQLLNRFLVLGGYYYHKQINGMIEFSNEEIDMQSTGIWKDNIPYKGIVGKGDFDYKLVYGEYPSGHLINGYQCAISTYLAESILKYINFDGSSNVNYDGKIIKGMSDLVGTHLTDVRNDKITFKITGIIEVGEIPEKYKILQTESGKEVAALYDDFRTFINSAPYQSLFVGEGFIDNYIAQNNRTVFYNSLEGQFEINESQIGSDIHYGVDAINVNNVYSLNDRKLFDEHKNEETGETTYTLNLKDGEVIISALDLVKWYEEELRKLSDYNDRNKIKKLVSGINYLQGQAREDSYNEAVALMKENFGVDGELTKPLNIVKSIENINVEYEKEFKVVGVYFDMNNDLSFFDWSPIIFTPNDMTALGIYNNQGRYSRILASLDGANIDALADYMTREEGIKLNWFKNYVIESVAKNEKTVQQFFQLFLYVSLILAVFSIFMLFNYITTSINSKRQTIGILRALGSGGKDIFYMFATESVVIALINGVFASLFTGIGSIFVNRYIRETMNFSIDFAYFGVRQVALIFLFSLITAVISSLLPIIRISKEKPVDLIRKN